MRGGEERMGGGEEKRDSEINRSKLQQTEIYVKGSDKNLGQERRIRPNRHVFFMNTGNRIIPKFIRERSRNF